MSLRDRVKKLEQDARIGVPQPLSVAEALSMMWPDTPVTEERVMEWTRIVSQNGAYPVAPWPQGGTQR